MTYYLLLACLVLWISTLFSHRTSFSLYIALFRYPSHICTPLIITMVSVISCNIFPARLFQYPHVHLLLRICDFILCILRVLVHTKTSRCDPLFGLVLQEHLRYY